MRVPARDHRPLSGILGIIWVAAAFLLPAAAGAGALEPFLMRLAEGTPEQDDGASRAAGDAWFCDWDSAEAARGRTRVSIHRSEGAEWSRIAGCVAAISPRARWEGQAGDLAQAIIPFDDLAAVAALPEIVYVARPPRPVSLVERSEGLAAMEVLSFQALGHIGEGARVGVIDLGFDGYAELLGTELPREVRARSFYRSPSGEGDITGGGEDHGTACAEIIHDIAPGARLYLANVATPVDFKSAVDWMIAEKVDVISQSVGWYFGSLDGRGPINDVVEEATRSGIVWINAAGNEAERHTWNYAADSDGDRLMEFNGDEEIDFHHVLNGETLRIALLWDHWPLSTDLDFALEFIVAGSLVASSDPDFAGYPYAFRYLEWTRQGVSGSIAVRVRHKRGVASGRILHLFCTGQGARMEEHAKPDRSLLTPADTPSAIAVGAVDWETLQLDSYSSRGAAEGGPVKPELCGPVGVTTRTYHSRGFRGTSAAAPHAAGAAALVAAAGIRGAYYDLVWSREEIRLLLERNALPAPQIPSLAWGIVRMPSPGGAARADAPLRILGNPAVGRLLWSGPCSEIEILDAGGRVLAAASRSGWDGIDAQGKRAPAGIYFARCRGGSGAARLLWLGTEGSGR